MSPWQLFLTAIALAALASPARAGEPDAEGCKDHPLFNRMPNVYIARCEHSQFEMRRYPVGPVKDGKAKLRELEGEYWMIEYALNEGTPKLSGLQVQRNFQNAARAAGGSVEGSYPPWCDFELDESFALGNQCTNYGTTLKITKGGRETWTFVNALHDAYTLLILEVKEMKQEVSVNELADRLSKDGFLTLYVNFDTGKATIKPDSAKTLDDAAGALKAASGLRVQVGGHTDNAGTPAGNEKLSAERAQAVMAALVSRGIPASRLTAKGYGQSSPIADNRTEEGRAKNRRVELVKQ
jgi:outer membrane protein OmpA-like peptidoglycan-associated protein